MNIQNNHMIGDLMEPDPIGFGFDAPGWTILVIVFVLAMGVYGLRKLYLFYKNKYRRLAISEIRAIDIDHGNCGVVIFTLVNVLKRVAITAYGRRGVATLQGCDFFDFLKSKIKNGQFSQQSKVFFTKHIYEGDKANVTAKQLVFLRTECINWIKMHYV